MLQFHFRTVLPHLVDLPRAIATSLTLTGLAIAIGFPGGLVVLWLRRSRTPALRWIAVAYVEVLRNTPLLAILYLTYFGLPRLGLRTGGTGSALVALSLNCSAYAAEVFRAGLLAVPPGQTDAAAALGLKGRQAFRLVLFPQVLATVYGPLGNIVIQVLLGSSLASAVAVGELADWMQNVGSETFRYFETFAIAGLCYVVLCQAVNLARLGLGRLILPRHA